MPKEYLGDGVYADYDGYQLVLTAENGIATTNTIYLDDLVFSSLLRYVERLKGPPAMDEPDEPHSVTDHEKLNGEY